MADEKMFTIPLRREFLKVAMYRRSKKAVSAVRKFIARHMKVEEVKIGKNLNLFLWAYGMKNPPPRVKVKSVREENYALVELQDYPFAVKKVKEEKKGLAEKILGKKEGTKQDEKMEQLKEMKKQVEHSEQVQTHKEHKPESIEVPAKELKQNMRVEENTLHRSKVIPESGRKERHEGKP